MRQHVVSEWLLKSFAAGGGALIGFDKETGRYDRHVPKEFMVEVDAHTAEFEDRLEEIETPASQAALRLVKRVRALPPGLYAVVPADAPVKSTGPDLVDVGVVEGMRLLVGQRELPSPSDEDRRVLALYAGLMYQRTKKTVEGKRRLGEAYAAGAAAAMAVLMPSMSQDMQYLLDEQHDRMFNIAANIEPSLAGAPWWVVRADAGQAFVLGDNPVAATIQLGHEDDRWQAIVSEASFAIVMPLNPSVALLIALRRIMPVGDLGEASLTTVINRLMWRWADQHVLARELATLEDAWVDPSDAMRRARFDADIATDRTAMVARGDAARIFNRVMWRRWVACRLTFGFQPFAPGDRVMFRGPGDHG